MRRIALVRVLAFLACSAVLVSSVLLTGSAAPAGADTIPPTPGGYACPAETYNLADLAALTGWLTSGDVAAIEAATPNSTTSICYTPHATAPSGDYPTVAEECPVGWFFADGTGYPDGLARCGATLPDSWPGLVTVTTTTTSTTTTTVPGAGPPTTTTTVPDSAIWDDAGSALSGATLGLLAMAAGWVFLWRALRAGVE